MVIVILDNATPAQKGVMSRLTLELKAGVFVGNLGRRVREKLWRKISADWNASALLIFSTNNEQGYAALSNGDPTREIVEMEGMILTAFTHRRGTRRQGTGPDESTS